MLMPCDQHIDCSCSELPLSNFSSEDPDRLLFLGRSFGYPTPPDIIDPPQTPTGCPSFSQSPNSIDDANWCADFSFNECEMQEVADNPCFVCRQPSGSNHFVGGLGFGFGVAGTGANTSPCCDPDIPAECCCDSSPSNPEDPPTGGDARPDRPPNAPPTPPRLFCNDPQTCTVDCPGGLKSTGFVAACQFSALSKAQANRMAKSAACFKANEQRICTDDRYGGGNPCKVFCQGEESELQLSASAKNGTEVTWSIQSGSLPQGMTMDGTGKISGTPTGGTGQSSATVKLTDGSGNVSLREICINIMAINTASLPNGSVCAAYNATITAGGGYPPYTFGIDDGVFPDGLTMDEHGAISGTPNAPGNYGFTVSVTDHLDNVCLKDFSIQVTGIANTAITSVRCPTNPAISVPVNVPAGMFKACAGETQDDVDSLAQAEAMNQAAAAMGGAGCSCYFTNVTSVPGGTTNQLISTNCDVSLWVIPATVPANQVTISAVGSPFQYYGYYFSLIGSAPHGKKLFCTANDPATALFSFVYP